MWETHDVILIWYCLLKLMHNYLVNFKTTIFTGIHSDLHQWFNVWTTRDNTGYLYKLANVWSLDLPDCKWPSLRRCSYINFTASQTNDQLTISAIISQKFLLNQIWCIEYLINITTKRRTALHLEMSEW